jgi:hypothetical protein
MCITPSAGNLVLWRPVTLRYGVEPIAYRDPVPLGSFEEPPVVFVMLAIIAVVSTFLVLLLRDKPAT